MYYVYILKNPITHEPFYVGVGKQDRCSHIPREQQHIVEAIKFREGKKFKYPNRHKFYTILQILDAGLEVEIEIRSRYETEQLAFSEEISLIAYYGRSDIKTGNLTNMTDGGEGLMNPSSETSLKRSKTMKGRPSPLCGRILGPHTEERKLNISKAKKGQPSTNKGRKLGPSWNAGLTMTAEQRKNMGAPKGRIPWNKGLTKETHSSLAELGESISRRSKGKTAHNKGIPSGKKGMTYEEIYGPEKAAELKEKRRLKKIEYWKNKNDPTA